MFHVFRCARCGKEIGMAREIPAGISVADVILTCDDCRKEPVQLSFDWEHDVNEPRDGNH